MNMLFYSTVLWGILLDKKGADNTLHTPANTRTSALQGRSVIRPGNVSMGFFLSLMIVYIIRPNLDRGLSILPGESRKKSVRNGAISLPFVSFGMNKIAKCKQEQVMLHQHTIDTQSHLENVTTQGILVPLDLAELKIVSQSLQADGSIEVHVIATTDRAGGPTCQQMCVKIHDTRERRKRDISLRG